MYVSAAGVAKVAKMDENENVKKEKSNNTILMVDNNKKQRKQPPPVRQTLTSKYRMLKANPVLMHELGKKVVTNCNEEVYINKPLKTLVAVMDNETNKFCPKLMQRPTMAARSDLKQPRNISPNTNKTLLQSNVKKNSMIFEKHTAKRKFAGPTAEELTKRLNDWLKRRGKSFTFDHLKCFGAQRKLQNGEDKENVRSNIVDRNSYEELRIDKLNKESDNFIIDLQQVTKEALLDLYKLILEGYPSDQCEIWLKLVKEKYRRVEEDPQYWECRAALEQTKGNINLAVECYKTAIVQGAEVKSVDQHLDQLLQKFSLLNIDKDKQSNANRDRSKIVQDARNIFKSSIIQFAVQERVLKKKSREGISTEKKLIATPVRWSTRLSRSAYTSTPGIHIYSSLQDVDDSMRETIKFQCNNALKD